MRVFFAVLVLGVAVSEGALPHTESLKSHLHSLETTGGALQQCLTKVTHPLTVVANFAKEVNHVMSIIHKLDGRVTAVVDVINGVMLIPYVGAFAAPVLGPAVTVMNTINNGLQAVIKEVDAVVKVINGWLKPVQTIDHYVHLALDKMKQVIGVITKAELETGKVEKCVEALPGNVKHPAEVALEKVTGVLEPIPRAMLAPVGKVGGACQQVQNFLHKIHLARRKRSLPSLSKVINVLNHIDGAFGPVGKFLDKVHDALNKKICLIGDIVKIGGKVVSKLDEVGKQVIKGAEHVGKEIGHVATNVGNEIVHTATNVGNEIKHTAETVGNGIKNTAENVGNSIKNAFTHLFGRRSEIDGQYYIIVDPDYDAKKRGADLCVSIHDCLNIVNGITKGMLGEAQKFIGSIFHGHSPFKIPGLTGDVLHLGGVLKAFHIPMPSVSQLLQLGGTAVDRVVKMNPLTEYTRAVPACKAALTG